MEDAYLWKSARHSKETQKEEKETPKGRASNYGKNKKKYERRLQKWVATWVRHAVGEKRDDFRKSLPYSQKVGLSPVQLKAD